MKSLILALATTRLTQLAVEDEITRPVRDAIDRWATDAEEFSFRERVAELSECPACMSIWAGAGILVAEQTGIGRFLVRVLALSQATLAVKTVIERIDR